MTSAQVVETSVANNSSFQNYPHPDDHTIRTTDTPGFKPFTNLKLSAESCNQTIITLLTSNQMGFLKEFGISKQILQRATG